MERFALASDAVDPRQVPQRTLYTGSRVPAIGLGTFGSDRFSADQVAQAVRGALAAGYRHIDCASVYGNEPQIGPVLAEAIAAGLDRRDLWITSKVWNDMHGRGRVLLSCERSLVDLRLDYLDLYLVHWPFPNYHPPGCNVGSRSPDARPYIHEHYLDTWRQMERLVEMGLVRHIGTSNMTIPKLERLLADARIRPACNEMELHPHFQQPELFQFCLDQGIQPIGFCPIGSPTRPDRDKTESDTVDIEDPLVVQIARRLGVHPAVVCVKWALQRGQIPIPFSIHRHEYLANLRAAVQDPLTDQEMRDLSGINKNCRLIKGQVFLWKDNQNWQDLWDLDGRITPP
ncbi:MAG: aldo/keto reductase [Sedimentisphaerales bacterium]|nr:aldo/keto reductase [Sedimentisphaerales bacterium]